MTDTTVVVDRPTLFRWRRAIMAAFGLGGITVAAWGPRLPAVKAELGISTATIGLLLAGVTVGAIAGLVALDTGTPLAREPGWRDRVAPGRRRGDGRHGRSHSPAIGPTGQRRLPGRRSRDRHPRRADQCRRVGDRTGRRPHPHAPDARGVVDRCRSGVGDRCRVRGARGHSLGAVHRRGGHHRGGRPGHGPCHPYRGPQTGRTAHRDRASPRCANGCAAGPTGACC